MRRDPNLVPGAIEETLRWASSTIYNRRTATAEIELHGRTIRALQWGVVVVYLALLLIPPKPRVPAATPQ